MPQGCRPGSGGRARRLPAAVTPMAARTTRSVRSRCSTRGKARTKHHRHKGRKPSTGMAFHHGWAAQCRRRGSPGGHSRGPYGERGRDRDEHPGEPQSAGVAGAAPDQPERGASEDDHGGSAPRSRPRGRPASAPTKPARQAEGDVEQRPRPRIGQSHTPSARRARRACPGNRECLPTIRCRTRRSSAGRGRSPGGSRARHDRHRPSRLPRRPRPPRRSSSARGRCGQPGPISSARRSKARRTAIRAASTLGRPVATAICE